jgi:RNA polymerase sigma-70 factor (ECF subfamily)
MILTLLHLEEKSVEEIATATGWNATLVKVRAFRARAKMKKALKTLAEEKL